MISQKLINLLKTLDQEEIKSFTKFLVFKINSPKNLIIQLQKYLEKQYPFDKIHKLNKEKIFHLLYPNEKVNEKKLGDVVHKLIKLLEDFIAYQEFQKETDLGQLMLKKRYVLDTHTDLFDKYHNKQEQHWEERIHLDTMHQLHYYLHLKQQDQYFETQNLKKADDNLQTLNDQLDEFYFSEKLLLASKMETRKGFMERNYEKSFIQLILDKAEKEENNPLLKLYYLIYKSQNTEPSENNIREILEYGKNNRNRISDTELKNVFTLLANTCIRQINTGKNEFLQILFDLYIQLLEQGLLYENGYLSQWKFKNIITLGTRLKKFDLLKFFIKEYIHKLPEKDQKNAYTYNMAMIHYQNKNYKDAIFLLFNVEFVDLSYNLGARSIQLISYFELNDVDLFEYTHNAFKWFLTRNKNLATKDKSAYFNLLKFSRKLFNFQNKLLASKTFITEHQIEALEKDISKTSPLMNKSWIDQKMLNLKALKGML